MRHTYDVCNGKKMMEFRTGTCGISSRNTSRSSYGGSNECVCTSTSTSRTVPESGTAGGGTSSRVRFSIRSWSCGDSITGRRGSCSGNIAAYSSVGNINYNGCMNSGARSFYSSAGSSSSGISNGNSNSISSNSSSIISRSSSSSFRSSSSSISCGSASEVGTSSEHKSGAMRSEQAGVGSPYSDELSGVGDGSIAEGALIL